METFPRGWSVVEKNLTIRTNTGDTTFTDIETVGYEVVNKRQKISKKFVSLEAVKKYFRELEYNKAEKSALAGKGAPSPAKGAILMATKDIYAANELGEIYE